MVDLEIFPPLTMAAGTTKLAASEMRVYLAVGAGLVEKLIT